MIQESEIRKAIINASLTFSAEDGQDHPMRNVPLADLTTVIVNYLRSQGLTIVRDETVIGKGKRNYYYARAELARKHGDKEAVLMYEALAESLPFGGADE